MGSTRRWTAGLLTGAFLLAVSTPSYLAYSRPSLAVYLLHPSIFMLQSLPYAAAGALWIPAWSWGKDTVSLVLAAGLVTICLALYVPVLWAPGEWGGDMIALAFLAMSGATMGIVIVTSGLTALVLWWHRRRAPGLRSEGVAP